MLDNLKLQVIAKFYEQFSKEVSNKKCSKAIRELGKTAKNFSDAVSNYEKTVETLTEKEAQELCERYMALTGHKVGEDFL